MAFLSSRFVLHFASKLSAAFYVTSDGKKAEREKAKAKKQKKRRGGGGAWRAFCHEVCQGVRFTAQVLSELSARFRRLSPEEKERYRVAGQAATESHKQGFAAFFATPASNASRTASTEPAMQPEPGHITSTGAMVAADCRVALQDQLLLYTGPDFFLETYQQMQIELGKRGVSRDRDGLTLEEQEELRQFRTADLSGSNGVVSSWHEKAYHKVTGSLSRLGSKMAQLHILQYVPPMLEAAKVTWFVLSHRYLFSFYSILLVTVTLQQAAGQLDHFVGLPTVR